MKSIIIDHEYYFPTSSELNDPAECKTTIFDHSKEEMESFLIAQYLNDYPNTSELEIEKIKYCIRNSDLKTILNKEWWKTLNEHTGKTYGLFCLSKRPDNLALWAHYADDHRGYCLEFANLGNLNVYEVSYGNKLPFSLDPCINQQTKNVEFLYTKAPEWEYEQEARILDKPGVMKFPPNFLKSIILGKNISETHMNMIIDWCKVREVKLQVKKAKFNDSLLRMEYLTIE